jgi:hypothetical protein
MGDVMNVGKKPHKHAEVIKAWADGAEIQYRAEGCTGNWMDNTDPLWNLSFEYRVKPREFPKSSLSDELLARAICNGWVSTEDLRTIADFAIKQYILDLEKEAANG